MQFIPCIILVVLTIMILIKLSESKQRKELLKGKRKDPPEKDQKTSESNQTSNALLAIVILFLICELPVALLLFICTIDTTFLYIVFVKVKYFTFMLRLLNASLNFVMYCFMSSLFRATFYGSLWKIFCNDTQS